MSAAGARVPARAFAAVAAAAVVLAACASALSGTGHRPPEIQRYVTNVHVLGQDATSTVVATALGAGVAGAPSVSVPQSATVINGGSVQEQITASGPFQRLRIGIRPGSSTGPGTPSPLASSSLPSSSLPPVSGSGSASGAGPSLVSSGSLPPTGVPTTALPTPTGVGIEPPTNITLPPQPTVPNSAGGSTAAISTPPTSAPASSAPVPSTPASSTAPGGLTLPTAGYEEITLRKPTSSTNVIITLTQDLPGGFTFYFAVVDEHGHQGLLAQQHVQAVPVGAGDVQVSVSWDRDSDTDLHVVDPSGEEIYWDNKESSSGGVLDLDSNADCHLDHKRNENVTWQKPPPGTYTVRVDYYDNCGEPATDYVVTVQVVGHPTRVYNGTLTGDGDHAGSGGGTVVATFTVP